MRRPLLFILLSLFPSLCLASHAEILPTLPDAYRESHFKKVNKDFQSRWAVFSKKHNFIQWTYGRSEESIKAEFDALDNKRRAEWFKDGNVDVLVARSGYEPAQVLLASGAFRNLNTLGFATVHDKNHCTFPKAT